MAAESPDAVISPFVDSQTIVVVRADTHLKASETLNWMLDGVRQQNVQPPMIDALRRAWQPGVDRLDRMLDGLAKAKVSRIYWIANLSDFLSSQGPQGLWAAPLEDVTQVQTVSDLLINGIMTSNGKPMLHARQIGPVVVASADGRQSGMNQGNALGADWTEALAGQASIRVAVVPGSEMRRSLEENVASLPSPSGPVPITTFTRGINWIGLSVNPPPQPSVSMVAKSPDAPSANAAGDAAKKLLAGLQGQKFPMEGLRPSSEDLVRLLTPTVDGDELKWSPDVATLVKPMLVRSATQAARVHSASNMRQLLLGIIMDANSHKGEFPRDLASMMKNQEMSPNVLIDPLDPQQKLGFVYVPPPADWRSKGKDNVVPILYEEYPEGHNVGFSDGHVEWFATRQQVEELFKQRK
jgi:prepilin-type processing-associated H-X9-DG protein